jgi:proline dehydrogenase
MLEALPKAAFAMLAGSELLKRLADRYGMGRPAGAARRFIAGQTIDDAIAAAQDAEEAGYAVVFDHLAPPVTSIAGATDSTRRYVEIINRTVDEARSRQLSLTLGQLGLAVDRATALDNLRRVLDAGSAQMVTRVDSGSIETTDVTLDTVETLWNIGYRNVGVVVQAALRRSLADVQRCNTLGISVRLVKGGAAEGRDISYQTRADIGASFRRLMERLLRDGQQPAFGTHDPGQLAAIETTAAALGIDRTGFEVEFRHGVRPDLHTMWLRKGHIVRIYLPFGQEWFPYFMRQLGERPGAIFHKN